MPRSSLTSARRFEFEEFCEPITSRTSTAGRQRLDGVLAVRRGVADVLTRRSLDPGEPRPEDLEDLVRLVDGQGGLREVGEVVRVVDLDGPGLLGALDQDRSLGGLARGPHDLLVTRVSDQDDRAPVQRETAGLHVHLGDERARGVDHLQAANPRVRVHVRSDAVRGEHRRPHPREPPSPRRRTPRPWTPGRARRAGCARSVCARTRGRRAWRARARPRRRRGRRRRSSHGETRGEPFRSPAHGSRVSARLPSGQASCAGCDLRSPSSCQFLELLSRVARSTTDGRPFLPLHASAPPPSQGGWRLPACGSGRDGRTDVGDRSHRDHRQQEVMQAPTTYRGLTGSGGVRSRPVARSGAASSESPRG